MTTKANRPKKRLRTNSFICYSGEQPEELFSYPPRGQYDVLVQAFREGIQRKAAQKGERALTIQEHAVLAVTALFEEVNNGGYDQFFRNRSRKFGPIIVNSLMQIGLLGTGQNNAGRQSMPFIFMLSTCVPSMLPWRKERRAGRRLEECDRSFYKTQRGAARKIYLFLKANRAHIKV